MAPEVTGSIPVAPSTVIFITIYGNSFLEIAVFYCFCIGLEISKAAGWLIINIIITCFIIRLLIEANSIKNIAVHIIPEISY